MANKKISELTTATGATTSWYTILTDPATGLSYKITAANFSTLIGGGGGTTLSTPTLTATVISSTQIDLSWTNVSNESSYLLQRSPDNATWTTINSPAANVTTYSNTGLTPSTLYYYRIKAVGDGVTYLDSSYGTDNDTTSGSFSGTALTWATLGSDHEQWNTSLGIRRKSTEIDDWEAAGTTNISVSTQTFVTGDRVAFSVAVTNKACIIALQPSNSPQNLTTSTFFGLTTDSGGGTSLIQAWEGGASTGATRAGSASEFYCIFFDGATIKYQYSTDFGSSWTTFQTSAGSPSGTYYCQVMIYHADFGPDEIYKA